MDLPAGLIVSHVPLANFRSIPCSPVLGLSAGSYLSFFCLFIFKVDMRFCPPISYSHCHVPIGSTTFSSAAPAKPQTPRTNAIERIAFIIASEIVKQRKPSHVDRHPYSRRLYRRSDRLSGWCTRP